MDGLLLTMHIDEAHPSTQMDEPLLFTVTSPSLHSRQMGSFLQFTLTSSSHQSTRTSSHLLLSLTSSPLNLDERAPTSYVDEPFTVLLMDGLQLTIFINELSPQLKRTSFSYLHGRALHQSTWTSSTLLFILTRSLHQSFRLYSSGKRIKIFQLEHKFPKNEYLSKGRLHRYQAPGSTKKRGGGGGGGGGGEVDIKKA